MRKASETVFAGSFQYYVTRVLFLRSTKSFDRGFSMIHLLGDRLIWFFCLTSNHHQQCTLMLRDIPRQTVTKLKHKDCKTPDTLNIFDKGFSIFDERTTKHTKEDRKNLLIRFFFHSKQSTFFEDQLFYLKLRSSICQSPRFTAGKVNNRRYTLSAFF